MRAMTIRNVPLDMADALEVEKRRRGLSLNRTVLQLIREALGLSGHDQRSNGLRKLSGGWSEDEFLCFEQATASFKEIDGEIWK